MLAELKTLGLLPGSNTYNVPSNWEGQPLWRTPPPGELHRRKPNELPKPDSFWLHPMFIWAPEIMLGPLLGSCKLPCIEETCTGEAKKKGVGRPRVVVGSGGGMTGMADCGQYYIMASQLRCNRCKHSPWYSDSPAYVLRLPERVHNLFPAYITYRKALCRSLVDQIRRSGRSPSDEVTQLLHARYESMLPVPPNAGACS